MNYGSLTTGKPEWLKQVEAQRKPVISDGNTYRQKNFGTRNCLIVRDYVDLTNEAGNFNELLCCSDFGPVFVDLGDASPGHDLIINPENGKVIVNGHCFAGVIGLICLGDGSWGIHSQQTLPIVQEGFVGLAIKIYEWFLEIAYSKIIHLGLMEFNPYHEKSILHLICADLPKGKIISKISA